MAKGKRQHNVTLTPGKDEYGPKLTWKCSGCRAEEQGRNIEGTRARAIIHASFRGGKVTGSEVLT